jgi:hypothetical protein
MATLGTPTKDENKWEMYVPQVGEMYAEGGQRKVMFCNKWSAGPVGKVVNPATHACQYRRPKEQQPCQSSDVTPVSGDVVSSGVTELPATRYPASPNTWPN